MEDCEGNYKLSNNCSNSETQGFKTKCARKRLRQNAHDKKWKSMFQSLLEYRDQHGNTMFPQNYSKTPQLRRWVVKQRIWHSKKKLSNNRGVLRLESIGSVWSVQRLTWESMFELLL